MGVQTAQNFECGCPTSRTFWWHHRSIVIYLCEIFFLILLKFFFFISCYFVISAANCFCSWNSLICMPALSRRYAVHLWGSKCHTNTKLLCSSPNTFLKIVLVYLERFRRNSVLKCVLQPKIAKNSLKTPILGVQRRSRLSMLVPLESSSALLVMISSKSVSICNRFHARWANIGKITISKGGSPLWCPRSRGISSPSGTYITLLEARDSRLSHSEDFMILRCVVLTQYSSVMDRWTDGQKDASTIAKAL